MGRLSTKLSSRRGATKSTTSLIGEWSMADADTNTTDLIGQWSMDGTPRDVDARFASLADAPPIVPAERPTVCGTAYDVPILVKCPGDASWRPLSVGDDRVADECAVAERLLGY
jgi:hypothetical protein